MSRRHVLQMVSGLLVGLFAAILAGTIVSNALPRITAGLGADPSSYTWVITGELLAMTATVPLWGQALRPLRQEAARAVVITARIPGLAGAPRVPEAPVAHSELAALTGRFEEVAEKTDREFGIIKSDLTAVRLQVGNLDQKVDRLEGRIEGLGQKMDRNQAQIVELLTRLVGQDPNAG